MRVVTDEAVALSMLKRVKIEFDVVEGRPAMAVCSLCRSVFRPKRVDDSACAACKSPNCSDCGKALKRKLMSPSSIRRRDGRSPKCADCNNRKNAAVSCARCGKEVGRFRQAPSVVAARDGAPAVCKDCVYLVRRERGARRAESCTDCSAPRTWTTRGAKCPDCKRAAARAAHARRIVQKGLASAQTCPDCKRERTWLGQRRCPECQKARVRWLYARKQKRKEDGALMPLTEGL